MVAGSVMIPRSTVRPAASASAVAGRTPTATTSRSQGSSLPFCSTTRCTVLPLHLARVTV